MTLSNAVKQRIIDLASRKKITLHKLSLESGIPYSTMSSFLNGKCTSITLTTLLHVCEGADVELKDFFDDPLFKNLELESTSSLKDSRKR
jgi:DNA-binding Xre family transcriptional regulator